MGSPIKFAVELVSWHGIKEAKRILINCARERIGKDGEVPNPYHRWYREGLRYVEKLYPNED